MRHEIKIGSVSWINEEPNPVWFSPKAAALEPDWIAKAYVGLGATANAEPPETIFDFTAYRSGKDFRALMYCSLAVTIDDKTRRVTRVDVLDAFHDPGWTPAFRVRKYPLSGLRFWDGNIWSNTWHAGEGSPISSVLTQARHPNSAISGVPAGETVLVDGIIKFRAGKHTNDIGVNDVGSPFHVPWVWCEMILTHDGNRFRLHGRGSIFPTHSWYLNGKRVATRTQVGDTSFPMRVTVWPPAHIPVPVPRISIPRPLTISVTELNMWPVFSAGAPATMLQPPPTADSGATGSVEGHRFTAGGGETVSVP